MQSALLADARRWVAEVHPSPHHLERALAWLVDIEPAATEGMRIAAAVHDIERAFPEPAAGWDSARDWDSREYLRWHQDRCAGFAATWLREQGADEALVLEVERLVAAHEDGGSPQADLVQAADSLSFLETMVPAVEAWVASGRAPADRAVGKLVYMAERIAPGLARPRRLAQELLIAALPRLDSVARPSARAGEAAS